MKKILIIALCLIPFAAYAEDENASLEKVAFPDGTVVQQTGTVRRYFMKNGQKWKIADVFTFRELGVPQKMVVKVSQDQLEQIPDGEVLKIAQPKIKGIIDAHEHYRVGGHLKTYFSVSKKLGIEKTVFVPTGSPPNNVGFKENMDELLEMQKKYPDQIIALCSVNEKDPDAPELFMKCLDEGGKGLKLMVGHPDYYDTPIDSDIMKQLFQVARERDVPMLLHVSIITAPQTEEEFKRLLREFPDVRVQFAHYCSSIYGEIHTDKCSAFLDEFPNLYIDLSMGGGIERYHQFMTKDMPKIKDFVLKYQDRVFFGSDMILAKSGPTTNGKWVRGRMMCDLSLHQNKWYQCPTVNSKGKYALLPGFDFSDEVLNKLYIENPRKFYKLDAEEEGS